MGNGPGAKQLVTWDSRITYLIIAWLCYKFVSVSWLCAPEVHQSLNYQAIIKSQTRLAQTLNAWRSTKSGKPCVSIGYTAHTSL